MLVCCTLFYRVLRKSAVTKFVKVQSQESKKNKTTHWQNKKVLRCCFLCVVCVKHGLNVKLLVDCFEINYCLHPCKHL